jgi:hypothetical protein
MVKITMLITEKQTRLKLADTLRGPWVAEIIVTGSGGSLHM